jgi:predicted DNA-binding protein (MmcQ/YjbR family)
MNIEELTDYCLSKKGVSESFPFGGDTLVFKVVNKIFALTGVDSSPCQVNLKCHPDWAIELREQHEDIMPGYHMNKVHWNTVNIEGQLDHSLIKQMIDHSYQLVVDSLSRKDRLVLETL